MPTLLLGLFFFVLAMTIHLVLCRLDPQKTLKTKLFMIIAIQNWVAFLIVASFLHWPFKWSCAAIYLLLIPVYLVFYVITELVSPSKRVLQIVAASDGAAYAQILKGLEQEDFIMTRLEELVQSGCAQEHNGRYWLTASGRAIAGCLAFYQKLLGREMGG